MIVGEATLECGKATVNQHWMPIDIARIIREQIGNRTGDFFWLCWAIEGRSFDHLVGSRAFASSGYHRCIHDTWANSIYTNTCIGIRCGSRPCDPNDTVFAGHIGGNASNDFPSH